MSYTILVRKIVIKSRQLFWNDWNREHIKKHNVTVGEIEEALVQYVQVRKGHNHRLIAFGKTKKNRLLAIVIKKTNKGYYIFSARDANRKERKYL